MLTYSRNSSLRHKQIKIEQQQQLLTITTTTAKSKMAKYILLFSKNSFISVVSQLNIATVSKTEFHNPIMF